eukprot:UN31599
MLVFLVVVVVWMYLSPPQSWDSNISNLVKYVQKYFLTEGASRMQKYTWYGKSRSRSRKSSGSSPNILVREASINTVVRETTDTKMQDLTELRNALKEQFPGEHNIYSDAYLSMVLQYWNLSKSKLKIGKTLEWRISHKINNLHYDRIKPEILQPGSLYLYGYDKKGRPIIWVRPSKKDWANIDIPQEVLLHVLIIEHAIRFMPNGVHQFVLIA